MSREDTEPGSLRTAAVIATAVGAVGSLGLTLYAGRHNGYRLMLVLFAGWVLAPFVALALADTIAKRWSVSARAALHGLMLVVAVGSLAAYTYDVFNPPKTKAAFVYVATPIATWLVMAIVVPIAALLGRAPRRR